ncbi:MAG: response regulator transcription factor [Chloroflexi bacterium]|nr:response regulator transcription factor [Chloroflexota bacterium]
MKVLIVDDDPDILEAVNICFALRWEDAELFEALDGTTAIQKFREHKPDVVILDLILPDIHGFEVCKTIRETSDVPVIMLTARGGEVDKVRGLEMGADDYITKPFSHLELLARIRAVMRRYQLGAIGGDEQPFKKGSLTFDFAAHRVEYNGEQVPLTPLEWNLMYHLVKNYPNVVQHRTLLAKVWGREYIDEMDYLKVHVQRIRSKFNAVEDNADVIANERGVGYRLSVID